MQRACAARAGRVRGLDHFLDARQMEREGADIAPRVLAAARQRAGGFGIVVRGRQIRAWIRMRQIAEIEGNLIHR
jgi:hypothetical protein